MLKYCHPRRARWSWRTSSGIPIIALLVTWFLVSLFLLTDRFYFASAFTFYFTYSYLLYTYLLSYLYLSHLQTCICTSLVNCKPLLLHLLGQWNNRYYPLTTVVTTSSRSAAHDMLVSGDAEGYLRLFRYPCTNTKAEYVEEKVYSSLVACARFLYNDQNVVTVGGTDAALMLWELVDE